MRTRLLFSAFLLITANTFAQGDLPYAEKAAQLQKEIWGTTEPEFKSTTIPDNLKNESAVILARSFSSLRTSNARLKFMIITANVTSRTIKLTTFHERVKINDKAALEDFSQLEYQKKLDNTVSLLITKLADTHNTYIGAKIIKPDGKEIVINTSEEVLTKNESKNQQGKLAIAGLQVGDILDYYISTADLSEKSDGDSYTDNDRLIMLAAEYPMQYFNINFQFNKKVKVKYITANNAPAFTESTNDAGDRILSLKVRNVPKYQSTLWVSRLRQYPYVEVGSSFKTLVDGGIKNEDEMTMLERSKTLFQNSFIEQAFAFTEIKDKVKDHFKSNKALKSAPVDSVMKVLYNEWKFNLFCNYTGQELENVNEMNYRRANSKYCTIIMSMVLTDMDIDHDILLVAPRTGNTLANVYGMGDFETMIRINSMIPTYMAFADIPTHFNEIPANFQGERAIAIHGKRRNAMKYSFTDLVEEVIPVVPADKNLQEEHLQVSLLPANMQKLQVARTVKQTGALRHDAQKLLIPVQDVDNSYMQLVNGEPLTKRLSRVKATKKMNEDYAFTFQKERDEMKKNFTSEVKGNFDQDPEQVANYKIINPALENTSPVFEYSSSFVLNNLVKKAGNNYIIDAGKLTGSFYALEEKDKTRTIDVYMPAARTFKYVINIAIPPGYVAKGLEELTNKKSNSTGSFTSAAVVNGNTLTITVSRVYANNFEKVANWPILKDLIQTASEFNDKKILLEKNG